MTIKNKTDYLDFGGTTCFLLPRGFSGIPQSNVPLGVGKLWLEAAEQKHICFHFQVGKGELVLMGPPSKDTYQCLY